MSDILYKFQKLTLHQWWWLVCAYVRLVIVSARIKFKQSAWMKEKISIRKEKAGAVTSDDRLFLQMHESVRLAARMFPGKPACLPRSIVLADMLGKRGYAAEVVLGVTTRAGQLNSHAWVEVSGNMIAEPENVAREFARLQSQ